MKTDASRLTLADVLAALAGNALPSDLTLRLGSILLHGAVVDSRLALRGSLFVAMRGQQHDGHDFIPQAIAKGAVGVIAERVPGSSDCALVQGTDVAVCFIGGCACLKVPDSLTAMQQIAAYWRRRQPVRVIGITGSIGKTTGKEAIGAVLGQRYETLKSEGNYNNEIGLPLTLLHLTAAHERAVLEMGMYDLGEIARLAHIALPQVGVVTNVGPTHLERLKTIERIAQAKAELPKALPPANEGGVAILNVDDERVRAMAGQTLARVFTYGLDPRADLWADDIESAGLEGIHFRAHYGRQAIRAHLPMMGRHSVHTALCAAAVGLVEGLSWEEILSGLQESTAQLRLVAVPGPAGSILLDDTYNASPASNIAALNLLAELDGRKIAVLGDMYELGPYEEEGHQVVGRRAKEVADLLITVGDLGRIIAEEAVQAGMPADAAFAVQTNAEAVGLLTRLIETGDGQDRVLVKGSRGASMELIVSALAQAGGPAVLDKQDGPV